MCQQIFGMGVIAGVGLGLWFGGQAIGLLMIRTKEQP